MLPLSFVRLGHLWPGCFVPVLVRIVVVVATLFTPLAPPVTTPRLVCGIVMLLNVIVVVAVVVAAAAVVPRRRLSFAASTTNVAGCYYITTSGVLRFNSKLTSAAVVPGSPNTAVCTNASSEKIADLYPC
jgi:hypothetical protein